MFFIAPDQTIPQFQSALETVKANIATRETAIANLSAARGGLDTEIANLSAARANLDAAIADASLNMLSSSTKIVKRLGTPNSLNRAMTSMPLAA